MDKMKWEVENVTKLHVLNFFLSHKDFLENLQAQSAWHVESMSMCK